MTLKEAAEGVIHGSSSRVLQSKGLQRFSRDLQYTGVQHQTSMGVQEGILAKGVVSAGNCSHLDSRNVAETETPTLVSA